MTIRQVSEIAIYKTRRELTVFQIRILALSPHVQFFALCLSIAIDRVEVEGNPLLGRHDPLYRTDITTDISAHLSHALRRATQATIHTHIVSEENGTGVEAGQEWRCHSNSRRASLGDPILGYVDPESSC